MALGLALAHPAQAAAPAAASDQSVPSAQDRREIVVIADRIKGQIDAPQPPVATFNEEDIAAYGSSSIADLLTAISPQTGSGRGRGASMPVILVGGQRIASFRELRDFPPEAIRKVEVLPEEVALRFGYSPDQRVVNFILKDTFRSYTGEIEFIHPDGGGANTVKGNASILKIDKGKRLSLTARADHTTSVTEADKGVVQVAGTVPTVAGDPDPAAYRTLAADTKNTSLNGTYTMPFGSGATGGSLTLNGMVSRADSQGYSGLNTLSSGGVVRTFDGPLGRFTRTDTYQAGASLNKSLVDWQLSATLDTTHTEASTATTNRAGNAAMQAALANGTPLASAGSTVALTNSDSVTSLVTLNGRPLQLPAGKLALTVKGGFAYSALRGSTSGAPVAVAPSSLRRGDASLGVNIAIPLTSTRENVLEKLGDLTANISAGANNLSDFGWLTNWSGGVTWNVTKKLGLQTSYVYSEAAPSLSALGAPLVTTQNVTTYDFTTGQSVLATIISGGNSALVRERRNDIKIGVNWTPPVAKDALNLVVEYFNNRSNNVTSAFPSVLTPAMEAALTGRVTRNGAGQITQIDRRAITLAETRDEHIRWGLNFGGNLGKEIKGAQRGPMMMGGGGMGGPPPGGRPGAGGPGGGPGGGPRMGGGGPMGRYEGRWNLSVYHTVNFVNRVLVAQNGPVLNLLEGDALASGGVARHALEFEGGGFYKGMGLRLNGTWSAPTRVTSAASDLRFGALFKANARLFIDLGQQKSLVKDTPFFKGARLSIYANNLFDQRQKVSDANGITPYAYQAAYMDPNGRMLGVEFRKMF